MAEVKEEPALITIEPDRMLDSWRGTAQLCALLALCCVACGCVHAWLRGWLARARLLQRLSAQVMETEKMLQNLYALDQKLASELEELTDFYPDY